MAYSGANSENPSGDHYVERFKSPRSVLYRRLVGGVLFLMGLLMFNNCGEMGSVQMASSGTGAATTSTTTPTGASGVTPAAEDPATKFASIAGVYGGDSTQIVFPDGTYWNFGGYGIIQARSGKISDAKDGKFNGSITGGNATRGAFSGTYVQGTSFGGSPYQASSKTAPNLGLALGTFWGNSQDGDTPYLTFDTKGGITGYSANLQCRFSGKVTPHPSGLNVLQLTLTRSNCLNNGKSDTYVGVARAYGDLVHVIGVTADLTKTFTYEGYYESNQNN